MATGVNFDNTGTTAADFHEVFPVLWRLMVKLFTFQLCYACSYMCVKEKLIPHNNVKVVDNVF